MARYIVVRACIAMQHPPRRRVNSAGGSRWLDVEGQDLQETLPEYDRHMGYDLIHFDLDPQNGMQRC